MSKGIVYGLHAFAAENEDEVSFLPGEIIHVLEKDDLYGDGWWQGRNAAGHEGLFPVAYTSPEPPSTPLPNPAATSAAVPATSSENGIEAPTSVRRRSSASVLTIPKATLDAPYEQASNKIPSPNGSLLSVNKDQQGDATPVQRSEAQRTSQPMKDTMTDLQAAIDSLEGGLRTDAGKRENSAFPELGANDHRSIRSSIVSGEDGSLYGESVHEEDRDQAAEGEVMDEAGWSAMTRKRLAEKAASENQRRLAREEEKEAQRREAEMNESSDWTTGVPPDMVYSDSDSEDDEQDQESDHAPSFSPVASSIPEPIVTAQTTPTTAQPPSTFIAPIAGLAAPLALYNENSYPSPKQLESVPALPDIATSFPTDPEPLSATPRAPASVVTPVIQQTGRVPSPVSQGGTPRSVAQALTPGEKSTAAQDMAATQPSSLAIEPSPFRTVIPDPVSPNSSSVEEGFQGASKLSDTQAPPSSAVRSTLPLQQPQRSPAAVQSVLPLSPSPQQQQQQQQPPSAFSTPVITNRASSVSSQEASIATFSPDTSVYTSEPGLSKRASSIAMGAGKAGMQGDPMDWSVDDVVDWAKRRGFDSTVWTKFQEHEITGDVLLELDLNLLKEIDIIAFGKRIKLASAIAELRPTAGSVTQLGSSLDGAAGGTPASIRSVEQSPSQQQIALNNPAASYTSVSQQQSRRASNEVHGSSGPSSEYFSLDTPPARSREFENTNSGLAGTTAVAVAGTGVVGLGLADEKTLSTGRTPSAASPGASSPGFALASAFQPTRIAEEPEVVSPIETVVSPVVPTSAESPKPANVSTDKVSTGSGSRDSGSLPASPALLNNKGSFNHRRAKQSVDESPKGSFVGNLLGNNRTGRKPAPRVSSGSGSSPTIQQSPSAGGTLSSFRRSTRDLSGGSANRKRLSTIETGSTTVSSGSPTEASAAAAPSATQTYGRALDRVPKADFSGFLKKKGERYNSWKMRYCVLVGPHFYYLKSENDSKFKGYINLQGYKVIADENAKPGEYGFRIIHDKEPTHLFSLPEQIVVREWMKALMKATITRDYSAPVVSSCNIPTMTLKEAQTMSPAPRPPSPTTRSAAQQASRRGNPNQLTARDASVLMGLSQDGKSETQRQSMPPSFRMPSSTLASAPPRPSREMRRPSSGVVAANGSRTAAAPNKSGDENIDWVNRNLPSGFPPVVSNPDSFRSGLALVRVVENITHIPSEIPVASFVVKTKQEHEDVLYRAFDYFIDAGVDMDGQHVDDVVDGNAAGINRLIDQIRARANVL
ncbi:Sterile alpha motif, type 2 [Phaffia rhodozyma]|uniref:Sterile alpha motif, type 2 n=1 Tax=Phaffia rhodozyma TaxID=264483 RepID=A0A0F7SWL7_PHARH|nr:Sterile alpha motif, type 2 [Phaffia rhodozyma]